MSITINHGNIATALGLASLAGQADRNRVVGQQDLQFLGMMQNAQGEADRNYASQIQLALKAKQDDRDAALQQQALAAKTAAGNDAQANADRQYGLNVEQLNSLNANRTATQGVQQQRIGLETDHQDTRQQGQDLRQGKFDVQQAAIGQLDPDTQRVVQANGGRFPYIPSNVGQDTDGKMLEAEYGRLMRGMQDAERQIKAVGYDPKDILGPRGQASRTVPGAAAGQEQAFQQAQQQYQALQQQAARINDSLNTRANGVLGGGGGPPGSSTANAVLQYFRSMGAGGQAAPPVLPGSSGGPPVVTTHEQYMALPSGATYINGNTGVTAVKP